MTAENTTLGSIHVSPRAVATIAYHAAMQSYGVVGLSPKNLADGLAHSLTGTAPRGVDVHYDGENLVIDMYVTVEYGTRIVSVAGSVANTVRYQVEKALGVKVDAVNVHVVGLRVSSDSDEDENAEEQAE